MKFLRSGTEEEYSQLQELLQDIISYREDMQLLKEQEKEAKKTKVEEEKQKGLEMRRSAMEGMSSE